MTKALFYRKCPNASYYKKLSTNSPQLGQELEYKIVWLIKCDFEQYQDFCSNFLKDDPILKKIKEKLTMDENDVVSVALVTYNHREGWLVYPSGFDYARYVAKWDGGDKNV